MGATPGGRRNLPGTPGWRVGLGFPNRHLRTFKRAAALAALRSLPAAAALDTEVLVLTKHIGTAGATDLRMPLRTAQPCGAPKATPMMPREVRRHEITGEVAGASSTATNTARWSAR
jgi:hypothetical protein